MSDTNWYLGNREKTAFEFRIGDRDLIDEAQTGALGGSVIGAGLGAAGLGGHGGKGLTGLIGGGLLGALTGGAYSGLGAHIRNQ